MPNDLLNLLFGDIAPKSSSKSFGKRKPTDYQLENIESEVTIYAKVVSFNIDMGITSVADLEQYLKAFQITGSMHDDQVFGNIMNKPTQCKLITVTNFYQ